MLLYHPVELFKHKYIEEWKQDLQEEKAGYLCQIMVQS